MNLPDIISHITHTPYFVDTDQHGQVIGVLYCADCLEILPQMPDGCVDLVVTDPPYGLDYNNGDLASNREKVFGGNHQNIGVRPIANDGEADAYALFESFLVQANRTLQRGGCCCCCCCGGGGPKPLFANWTLMMDKHIGFKQAVVWDKGGLGMGIHYRRNYEFMLVAQKPGAACTWNGGKNTPNIVRINKIIPSADQHSTEKPVDLMSHFIRLHSNIGGLVLEPFAGHAPTLEAAKRLGRVYCGIEIEERYCAIAKQRLLQMELF